MLELIIYHEICTYVHLLWYSLFIDDRREKDKFVDVQKLKIFLLILIKYIIYEKLRCP